MKKQEIEKKIAFAVEAANETLKDKCYKGKRCKLKIEQIQLNEWKKKAGEERIYINVVLRYDIATEKEKWGWGLNYYRKFSAGYTNDRYHRPRDYSLGIPFDLALTDKDGTIERIVRSARYVIDDVTEKEDRYRREAEDRYRSEKEAAK